MAKDDNSSDLQKAEISIEDTIEAMKDGFVLYDKDDKLLMCNSAYKKQLGDGNKFVKEGRTYSEITRDMVSSGHIRGVDGNVDDYISKLEEQRKKNETFLNTIELDHGKWIQQSDSRAESGNLVGLRTDVTELKQREHELEEAKDNAEQAQNRLTSAINAMNEGFVIFDKEDRLAICNDAFREQFGEAAKFVIEGETYDDMTMNIAKSGIIPGIEGKEREFVDQLIEQRKSDTGFVKVFQRHDGEWIRQHDFRTDNGELVGIRANITELKKREEELEAASSLLEETTNSMVQGIAVFDRETLQFFNPTLIELLKLSEEDLSSGMSYDDYLQILKEKGHFESDEIIRKNKEMMLSGETHRIERETSYGKYLRVDVIPHGNGNMIITYSDITDIKKRENDLQSTTELMEDMTNVMVQGLIVFEKGKLRLYNPRLTQVLDIDESELENITTFRNYMELLLEKGHLGEGTAGKRKLDEILEMALSGEAYSLERSLDTGKHIRVDTVPQDNENSLVITYTDITEVKKREIEIEETRLEMSKALKRQTDMAEAMAQGVIMFEHGKIVFFNKKVFELLEVPESILFEGQNIEDFLNLQAEQGYFGDVDTGKSFVNRHKSVIERYEPYQIERNTRSGKKLRVDGVPDKKTSSLTITFTDITSAKEREAELKEAMENVEKTSQILSASTNVMRQGILFFHEKKLEYFNPRFLELVGAPEDRVYIGMTSEEILQLQTELGEYESEETREKYRSEIAGNFSDNSSYQLERTMKNGNMLLVEAVAGDDGRLVVTYSDITDIKRRENELEEAMNIAESAERAKSEFLANMSHEIRTPMNGVMGMAELLAATELDTKQKMFTDVIVKSGASLLTIINDILDFSKIDAGQMELDPAPFNLAEAIEDVATLVSAKVAEKDLELIVRVDPKLPKMLVGDVGRIRQIVTNLLGNAVKFTEKGHVYVNVDGYVSKDNTVQLEVQVEDTGIGIPKDKLAQVFNKFSQVDTSATRKHEGTGLGLSIATSLIRLMGGEMKVESEVGKGSVFSFDVSLPAHESAEPAKIIPGDVSGATVLVIDDNEVNRSILTEQLNSWNFDSASSRTGMEGLRVMRAALEQGIKLDLVILDYQMPEMSGAEVLQTMREDELLKDIPVIMLTSVDSSQTNQRLTKLGAEANLTKPTRSSMLLETILQVIANSRANLKVRIAPKPVADPIQTSSPALQVEHEANAQAQQKDQQLDILVAEDNEVNQIVFRQILESTGLNFMIVENGRLAFAEFQARSPRMILMDVSMPEMNGKEATRAIRAFERDKKLAHTPIVGVTAHALKGDMESCIDAGMDDYLSKPVSPNKLITKVEQWLKLDLEEAKNG